MTQPDWWYDDLRQVGLDFADPAEVATYDERQGATEREARALLQNLGVGRETTVADIGCGTGLLACEAARMGRSVRAIDISPACTARCVSSQASTCVRRATRRIVSMLLARPCSRSPR